MGEVDQLFSSVPLARNSGFNPLPNSESDLLPNSQVLTKNFLTQEFCLAKDDTVLASLEVCLGTFVGLNCLYVVGLSHHPIVPKFLGSLSEAQKRTCYHIFLSWIGFVDASKCLFFPRRANWLVENVFLTPGTWGPSGDPYMRRRSLRLGPQSVRLVCAIL